MQQPQSNLRNMILAMITVAALSALVLSLAYTITYQPIQKAKDAKKLEAIREVLAPGFDNNPFEDRITISGSKIELYPAREGSKITSVAMKTSSNNGFSGKIEVIVGFLLDGTITGYKVIEHKETPGLGSKITENKFAGQLQGFNVEKKKLKVRQDGGDIDAITSATISSRAVLDAIQRAFDCYSKFNVGKKDE